MCMKKIYKIFIVIIPLFFIVGLFTSGIFKKSKLPKEMPEDFSFSLEWNHFSRYDSKKGIIDTGYSYDLKVPCRGELKLTKEELEEIYQIIRKAKIDRSKERVLSRMLFYIPRPALTISIEYSGYTHRVFLDGASIKGSTLFYLKGRKTTKAIRKIVNNYIITKDEYKNLPENQQRPY